MTFILVGLSVPVSLSWALWRGSWLAGPAALLLRPFRASSDRTRAFWVWQLRFARKLWIAALVGGYDYSKGRDLLALLIFLTLMAFLLGQLLVRPYRSRHDNAVEAAACALLVLAAFVAALASPAAWMMACLDVARVALLLYAVWRVTSGVDWRALPQGLRDTFREHMWHGVGVNRGGGGGGGGGGDGGTDSDDSERISRHTHTGKRWQMREPAAAAPLLGGMDGDAGGGTTLDTSQEL